MEKFKFFDQLNRKCIRKIEMKELKLVAVFQDLKILVNKSHQLMKLFNAQNLRELFQFQDPKQNRSLNVKLENIILVLRKFCQYLLDQTEKSKYLYFQEQRYELPRPFPKESKSIPSEMQGLDMNYQQYIKAHLYLIQSINYLYIFHEANPSESPHQDSLFSSIFQTK